MPKLFSFILAVCHTSRGVLHLVSTRQRIGKPALGIGIPERDRDLGKRRDRNKSSPVIYSTGHTCLLPQVQGRAMDKVRVDKAGQKPLGSSSKLQNCRPQLRPRWRT